VAIVLSLLPDVDALLPGLVHRGLTHTLLFAVLVGLLVPIAVRLGSDFLPGLGAEHAAVGYLVGVGGLVSHLAGDIITPMGVQLLFPVWQPVYTLDIVPASSPGANSLLLLTGVSVLLLTYSVPVRLPPSDADEQPEGLSAPSWSRR
jgi:inner membrane protein